MTGTRQGASEQEFIAKVSCSVATRPFSLPDPGFVIGGKWPGNALQAAAGSGAMAQGRRGALHESARIVRDGRDFTLQIGRSRTDQQSAGTDVPVKRAARAAGLDPAAYAAHSLRSGFPTTSGRDGTC